MDLSKCTLEKKDVIDPRYGKIDILNLENTDELICLKTN